MPVARFKRWLRELFLRHARSHRVGAALLARLAERYLGAYRNHDYRMSRNGEARVLESLARFRPGVLFDVGANRGEWSAAALAALSLEGESIHAFEIAPSIATELAQRFHDEPRVVTRGHGLSDVAGSVEIDFFLAGGHTGTTLVTGHAERVRERVERQTAAVMTGDEYCREQGITRIHFLKIDAEGAEPKVLAGFEAMFRARAIDLVQFEYNSINISTRYLLRDFYSFFEGHGFVVGKLWPHGVSFGAYDTAEENFRGPNYVAVRAELDDLRAALEYHPGGFR